MAPLRQKPDPLIDTVSRSVPQSISVVIPTLNEETELGPTVERIRRVPEVNEVIVVDGGSVDATVAIARAFGCEVLIAPAGRGGQMRAGAVRASGDVVLLLHADTWLPAHAGAAIVDCLRDNTVVAGGFWKMFRQSPWLLRGSRLRCGMRLLIAGRVLGDQAMFVRRPVLEHIGGVPDVPLMEEFELCARLRRVGRLALAGATVSTSARRFRQRGVWRTWLRMWRVSMQYRLGTSATELRRLYERP